MGWCSATEIFQFVAEQPGVQRMPIEERITFYREFMDLLRDQDWDCVDDVRLPIDDIAWSVVYAEYRDEDDCCEDWQVFLLKAYREGGAEAAHNLINPPLKRES